MQFYDEVVIAVSSWRWWDGSATWRREKHVPYWGPSWWDWGDWGDVFIQASHHEYTLMPLRTNKVYKAQHWENWWSKDKYWKHWDDITVTVPVWTLIFDNDTWEKLAELTVHGQRVRVAKWWRGGAWNKHFVHARKQFSTIAFYWEPLEKRSLKIEVQLIADIALMWAPSVWKSSLIASISNVKPKIAEYHFTTITPNIGVVEWRRTSFTVIDIPGLIEWAAEGKWLWNTFLRHILKASALCVMADISRFEIWIRDISMLLQELERYIESVHNQVTNHRYTYEWNTLRYEAIDWEEVVVTKYINVVISKIDLIQDDDIRDEYIAEVMSALTQISPNPTRDIIYPISMATREWIPELIEWMETQAITRSIHLEEDEIKERKRTILEASSHAVTEQHIEIRDREDHVQLEELWLMEDHTTFKWQIISVEHPDISYLSFVLPRWNDEAELWWRWRMEAEWILEEIRWMGGKLWDIIHVPSPYATGKDRFIVRE